MSSALVSLDALYDLFLKESIQVMVNWLLSSTYKPSVMFKSALIGGISVRHGIRLRLEDKFT